MIEATTTAHVNELAENLSMYSEWDAPSKDVISREVAKAELCWTGLYNGRVVCIAGTTRATLVGGGAYLWMLSAKDLPARAFLKESRKVLKQLLRQYAYLYGFCDARATKWLAFLGADLKESVTVENRWLVRFEIWRA